MNELEGIVQSLQYFIANKLNTIDSSDDSKSGIRFAVNIISSLVIYFEKTDFCLMDRDSAGLIVQSLTTAFQLMNMKNYRENIPKQGILDCLKSLNQGLIGFVKLNHILFTDFIADEMLTYLSVVMNYLIPDTRENDTESNAEILGYIGYHGQRFCAALSFLKTMCSKQVHLQCLETLCVVHGFLENQAFSFPTDSASIVSEKHLGWSSKSICKPINEVRNSGELLFLSMLKQIIDKALNCYQHNIQYLYYGAIRLLTEILVSMSQSQDTQVFNSSFVSECSYIVVLAASKHCILTQKDVTDKSLIISLNRYALTLSNVISMHPQPIQEEIIANLIRMCVHCSYEQICEVFVALSRRIMILMFQTLSPATRQTLLTSIWLLVVEVSKIQSSQTYYRDRSVALLRGLLTYRFFSECADIVLSIANTIDSIIPSPRPSYVLCIIHCNASTERAEICLSSVESLYETIFSIDVDDSRIQSVQSKILSSTLDEIQVKSNATKGIYIITGNSIFILRGVMSRIQSKISSTNAGDKRKILDQEDKHGRKLTEIYKPLVEHSIQIHRKKLRQLEERLNILSSQARSKQLNIMISQIVQPLIKLCRDHSVVSSFIRLDYYPAAIIDQCSDLCVSVSAACIKVHRLLTTVNGHRETSSDHKLLKELYLSLLLQACRLLKMSSHDSLSTASFEKVRKLYTEMTNVMLDMKQHHPLVESIIEFVNNLPKVMKNQQHSRALTSPEILPYVMAYVKGVTCSSVTLQSFSEAEIEEMKRCPYVSD